MNWLLTNCAAPRMAPFGTGEKRPPLGIGFLASALRNAGHHVRFIDNYLRPSDFLETDFLNRRRIDAIGISASTICAHDLHRMLDRLRHMRDTGVWSGKVVVGGPHTTAVPDDIPEWVDHVVQGEGEEPIVAIAEGETERVLRTTRTKDLDALAPPAWDLFAGLPYDWTASWLKVAPVFTMNTSRGCPFKCSFCSTPDIWGRAYRYFSADWVIEQIKHLVKTYGAKGVYFREDNFSVHRKRVTEFCEKLLSSGINIQWVCETRVDTLRRDLLELMHRAGCRGIYVGVESGSQRVLDYMQKDIKLGEVHDVFRWCSEIGIRTYASFVVGVPTETPEERALTVAMPEKIGATTHSMNVFVGVPTSRLYHHVLENNLYAHVDDRGLVYLKDHDALVDEFYGGNEARKIPTPERVARVLRENLTTNGRKPADDLDAWMGMVRDLLLHRPDARRVVVYGVGTNGQLLLRELMESACLGDRELLAADDDDDPLTFELLDLPRESPRGWSSWPERTVAVVTPNHCYAMCEVLERAGGNEGENYVALARAMANGHLSEMQSGSASRSRKAASSAAQTSINETGRTELPVLPVVAACSTIDC